MPKTYDSAKWPFVRECQSCGHKQLDTEPKGKPTPAYEFRKCKKCGSESFDYGSKRPYTQEQIDEYEAWEKEQNEEAPNA